MSVAANNEAVESRARRAPFLWVSSAAFRTMQSELPERQRASVGWVYLCLASAASDYRDGTHEGFASTASEVQALTGMSRPTFRNAIVALEGLGLLLRETRTDAAGTPVGVRYVLLEPDQNRGGKNLTEGKETRQNSYPSNAPTRNGGSKKEETPYMSPSEKEDAIRSGDQRLKFRNKPATKEQTKIAVELLDVWNSETGQHLRMILGSGRQSSEITKILGAVIDYPDVGAPRWIRTLTTCLASPHPWWGKKPQPGNVFGPGVVGLNLEDPTRNAGRPPAPQRGVQSSIAADVAAMSDDERAARLRADVRAMREIKTG